MDIKGKRKVPGAQGSSASDQNPSWSDRATSWATGAQTDCKAIQDEGEENNAKFGIPTSHALPNPADSNSDADAPLGNPHNFSSNPGFFPGSVRPSGHNPTVGRTPSLGNGSIAMPDQQQTDPGAKSDVAPQTMTTGFGG